MNDMNAEEKILFYQKAIHEQVYKLRTMGLNDIMPNIIDTEDV
jgi:hypothetical protein